MPLRLRDIAVRCNVSANTVSLALRDSPRISADTRARVRRVANRLGYVPDPVVSAGMTRLRQPKVAAGEVLAVVDCRTRRQIELAEAPAHVRRGIEDQARSLGYLVRYFHPREDGLRLSRLREVLVASGVVAVVLPCLWAWTPDELADFAAPFALCTIGERRDAPALHNTGSDHYLGAKLAVERVLALGYRRPGLVVNHGHDRIFDRRFSAGFCVIRDTLPRRDRLPVLVDHGASTFPASVRSWFAKHKPDVVLTDHKFASPVACIRKWGLPPRQSVVRLAMMRGDGRWSGALDDGHAMGANAVVVAADLHRRNIRGIPTCPASLLTTPVWIEGASCPSRTPLCRNIRTVLA